MNIVLPEVRPLKTRVDLSGQVAVVTGAGTSGGVGFGIARGLAEAGATVVAADLDLNAAQRSADAIAVGGHRVSAAQVDITDEASVVAMFAGVAAEYGSLEIAVCNAGISTNQITEQTPVEDWRRVLDVDLTGPFICAKAAVPHMTRAGYGRIVNISSLAGLRLADVHSASYTAANAAVLAFTRHLAYEVAGRGVTVNAVCPGPTLSARVVESMGSQDFINARSKRIPVGRLAQPEDVMRAVLFLASDLADMICGSTINVDGGELLGWIDTETYFKRRGVSFD